VSDICLFVSTEKWDLVSALIRRATNCAWSHAGFFRLSDSMTYSAMADGKGLTWRKVRKRQTVFLLDCENAEAMLGEALKWQGEAYNFKGVLGIIFGRNWDSRGKLFCDQTVFRAAEAVGTPLVNPTFIPREHLTPRDILLSHSVRQRAA